MKSYLVTFHTHLGALSFAKALESRGERAKLSPVPRAVSSSCGTGVRVETGGDMLLHITDDVDRVFVCENGKYEMIFESEE